MRIQMHVYVQRPRALALMNKHSCTVHAAQKGGAYRYNILYVSRTSLNTEKYTYIIHLHARKTCLHTPTAHVKKEEKKIHCLIQI